MTEATSTPTPTLDFTALFERIAEGALDRSRFHVLPHEQIAWLKVSGFTALRVPREFGGGGLSIVAFVEQFILLARADSQIAHALRGHLAFVETQINRAESADRTRWLKRVVAGDIVGNAVTETGPGQGLGTVLTPAEGGFHLDGTKFYSTGSIYADWIDVIARATDAAGGDRLVGAIVSTHQEGVTSVDDWSGFGQQLTGSGTTVFSQAFVAAPDLVDLEAQFASFHYLDVVFQGVLVALQAGQLQALAARTAGLVRDRTRSYTHGNAALPRHDPQVLQVVGELEAAAQAVTAIVRDLATRTEDLADSGPEAAGGTARAALQVASANAQVVVSRLALQATTQLFDALGASATDEDLGLDLYWRNARTIASHNPWIYKARISGDWAVNGTEPVYFWMASEAEPASVGS